MLTKLENKINAIFEIDCSCLSEGHALEDFYFINPMEEKKILSVYKLIDNNLDKAEKSDNDYISMFAFLIKTQRSFFGVDRKMLNFIWGK